MSFFAVYEGFFILLLLSNLQSIQSLLNIFNSVSATALTIGKGKGKEQSISVGAALSLSAINEDLTTVLSNEDSYRKAAEDDAQESSTWTPANLYIYCDKAVAKVCVDRVFLFIIPIFLCDCTSYLDYKVFNCTVHYFLAFICNT